MKACEENEMLENLYALHKNAMLSAAMRVLRDYQLAEDAVQKAFMKALANLNKLEAGDCRKTRAFLVVTARNVAITMYRSEKRQAIPAELKFSPDLTECSPFDLVFEKEELGIIREHVGRLGKKYADVLILKFFYGYNDREIARMVGANPENVRVRIYRSRKKLAKLLQTDDRFCIAEYFKGHV